MVRKRKRRRRYEKAAKPGSPPGTLPVDSLSAETTEILAYSPGRVHAIAPATLSQLDEVADFDVIWLNIIGTEDTDLLLRLARKFDLHSLSLEDVINVHQRAKFESYEAYNFCVLRVCTRRGESEQLSIFHSGKVVITIQERAGECLIPLRQRIENKAGQVRSHGSDYLVYALIDTVLDHYFPILEEYDFELRKLDDHLGDSLESLPIQDIHSCRRELYELRRWLRPHREMIGQVIRNETGMKPETLVYMKDCYDHVIQLSEGIEHCIEICGTLRDYHFNALSAKTNEVMKTLTIISTIFIPLSFLAGVYGMNFQQIPGLNWKHGFSILTAAMVSIGTSMLYWFYRRGWFR